MTSQNKAVKETMVSTLMSSRFPLITQFKNARSFHLFIFCYVKQKIKEFSFGKFP